ncbi:MAG: DUF2442 domain-containing protein [Desulfobacterales bacterium]|nr:DUF2442 domain-containing protein [Desulfobacterales bacterium]
MNSQALGKSISEVAVTNISNHGIWLLAGEKELFMSYEDFPWFKNVTVGKILNVEEPTPGHFYWPDLDVDLDTESIEHPKRFPLKSKYRISE